MTIRFDAEQLEDHRMFEDCAHGTSNVDRPMGFSGRFLPAGHGRWRQARIFHGNLYRPTGINIKAGAGSRAMFAPFVAYGTVVAFTWQDSQSAEAESSKKQEETV